MKGGRSAADRLSRCIAVYVGCHAAYASASVWADEREGVCSRAQGVVRSNHQMTQQKPEGQEQRCLRRKGERGVRAARYASDVGVLRFLSHRATGQGTAGGRGEFLAGPWFLSWPGTMPQLPLRLPLFRDFSAKYHHHHPRQKYSRRLCLYDTIIVLLVLLLIVWTLALSWLIWDHVYVSAKRVACARTHARTHTHTHTHTHTCLCVHNKEPPFCRARPRRFTHAHQVSSPAAHDHPACLPARPPAHLPACRTWTHHEERGGAPARSPDP